MTLTDEENMKQRVDLSQEGVITSEELAAYLKISKRTLFRKRAAGEIPPPVRLGSGTLRWRTRDVRKFLDGLKAR